MGLDIFSFIFFSSLTCNILSTIKQREEGIEPNLLTVMLLLVKRVAFDRSWVVWLIGFVYILTTHSQHCTTISATDAISHVFRHILPFHNFFSFASGKVQKSKLAKLLIEGE